MLFVPALVAALSGQHSHANENAAAALPHETIQIIVTTSKVTIGTNFAGTDLYIAGVVENGDPLIRRQNRYDIVITMEGPRHPVTVRKKERRMGMWVNADAVTFLNAPLYYALASTRELRDITTAQTYYHLGLGIQNLPLRANSADAQKTTAFREQFVRLKEEQQLSLRAHRGGDFRLHFPFQHAFPPAGQRACRQLYSHRLSFP